MYECGIHQLEHGNLQEVTPKGGKKRTDSLSSVGYQLLKIPHENMTSRSTTPSCQDIGWHDLIQVIMTTVSPKVSFQKTAFVSILFHFSVLLPLFLQCFLSLGSGGLMSTFYSCWVLSLIVSTLWAIKHLWIYCYFKQKSSLIKVESIWDIWVKI